MEAVKINAVIYARYSSDKQTEQSIEGQLRDCLAYAERQGLKIVGEYIDRAMSGTNDNRPEFQKMIADSSKKQFKYVLVYKFDRFARNMYDSAIYERKLELNDVKVISVTEQVGDGNEGIIVKAVLRAMAEIYSKQLGQNVERGMRESALKANSTGGTIPLGYKIENKKLVIDEKTAPFVKYIFEAYSQGATKISIANDISEKGYRKPNGKKVSIQNITYILNNIKYMGVFTYKDIQISGGCPALVDKDVFELCEQRAERERKHYGRKSSEEVDFLLFGKLFCGYCSKPMSGDCGTSRNGTKHHYYTCYTRKNKKRNGGISCNKKSEKKGFLEWYLVTQTKEYVLTPSRIEYIAERVIAQYNDEFSAEKIVECEKRLARIERDTSSSVEALIKTSNQLAIDKINEKLNLLEMQKSDAEIEIAKLRIANSIQFTKEELIEWLKGFCNGDPLDEEFQKRIIDTFINCIYLYDDKIVIYYNLKDGKQVSYIDMLDQTEQLASDAECSSSLYNGEPLKSNLFIRLFFCLYRIDILR